MYRGEKIFLMTDQTPDTTELMRPEDVQELFGIKKVAYYARLKFLNMEAHKDDNGKPYLDDSQMETLQQLDKHISETGKMEGFQSENNGTSLIKAEKAQLETVPSEKIDTQNPELNDEDIGEFDLAAQHRAAEILATAGDALTAKYIANPELLPPELRRKVFARSNGLPKLYDPTAVVNGIISAAGQKKEQND